MNRLRGNLTDEQRAEIRVKDRVRHSVSKHRETAEKSRLRNELNRVAMSEVHEGQRSQSHEQNISVREVEVTVLQVKHSIMVPLKSTKNANTLSFGKMIKCVSSAVPGKSVEKHQEYVP